METFKNICKKIGLYLLSILFLEFIFKVIMSSACSLNNIINTFLYSMIISAFLAIVSNIFKEKINYVITSINLFVIGLLFSIQYVFYDVFKVYFSLTNVGLGDQALGFIQQAVSVILRNILYIILFMLPFILYLIFRKKLNIKRNSIKSYIIYFIIIILTLPIMYINILATKERDNDLYELYFKVNEISLNINKLGVLNSYFLDFYRLLFGFDIKINYIDIQNYISNETEEKEIPEEIVYKPNQLDLNFSETSDININTINDYVKNETSTLQNKYTGIFKDYNLIYITAESFSEIGVSKELTPTLYKLTHTGFIFDNYYTPNALSTIGGEFQSLTGLYPDSNILNIWRSGTNYFPYGLGNIYKNMGYNTYAYHNNDYRFQDRNKYLASQGFSNFLGCYNGLQKRINCNIWPQSDDEMINATISDYLYSDVPFLAYYMTVSGHFEYTFSDNYMAYKHRNEVQNLNLSEAAKAYVATQIELDRALNSLLIKLEEANKLDKTVIVLLADHYPYELDINSINSLSSYERDEIVGVNHNALIIWNNKLEDIHITKPCMSSDVLPTVYNLFGIEYDSRLYSGRDILSDAYGVAIMRNRSWITDKGIYYANTGNFVGEEIDSEYIKNMNLLVNNRLHISKLILQTDYYRYLFK